MRGVSDGRVCMYVYVGVQVLVGDVSGSCPFGVFHQESNDWHH